MKGVVLVIDDDEGVRMTVAHVLAGEGYQISLAADGKQALDTFDSLKPDLVITDLIMPAQEGIETIIKLKKIDPTLKIIAMSGGARIGNDNILKRAQEMGADHIIAKPFEFVELKRLVERSIG